jgi:hypothetical protein
MIAAAPCCWIVAASAVGSPLPLRVADDRKQKYGLAGSELVRWLGLRESGALRAVPHGQLTLRAASPKDQQA